MKIKNFKRKLKRSIIAIFCYWIVFSTFLYFAADFIIFRPSKEGLKSSHFSKISENYEIKEIYQDQEKTLKAFFIPQKSEKIIIYFHGNVGMNAHIMAKNLFHKTDFNILIPTYFGYKPSTGKASEENFYLSINEVMKYVIKSGWKTEDIIIMGTSLGGAAAIYAASQYDNLDRTIVINTFDSIKSMCLEQYYIFCIFANNIINSSQYAQKIEGKIFQFHSKIDETVPYDLGKKLFNKIKTKDKKFFDINGTHNDFSLDQIINYGSFQ
jgi:esterase/lipase